MTPTPTHSDSTLADAPPVHAERVGGGSAWWLRLLEVVLAVGLAGLVFAQFENPNQHIDELYHVLAARSLNVDGDLMIGETGLPYTRAWGFTHSVALSFRLFGEGVWQSRLPSMLAGLALIGILFPWVRWRFGRLTSWLWLGLMLLSPLVIFGTEFCRFYMVQTAMVAALLVAGDVAIDRGQGVLRRAVALVLGLAAVGVALHMQVSSIFAVGTIVGGMVLCVLWQWGGTRDCPGRWRAGLIGGVVVLGVALLLAGFAWFEPLQAKWVKYVGAAAWAEQSRLDTGYYLAYLRQWHRWLYYLWPIAAVLACWRWRWRAVWVAAVFIVGLAAHSFGGMKAPRYLLWAMPYFWLTLAIGVSVVVCRFAGRAKADESTLRIAGRIAVVAAVGLLLAFAISRTPAPYQVKRMLVGGDHAYQYPDWHTARVVLERDPAWTGGVLLASVDTKAIDAFARCDYSLSRSRTQDRDEFVPDWRTGRPVISTGASLRMVIREHAAGVIVIERDHWRQGWAVSDEAADVIEAEAERLPIDPSLRLVVFRWDRRGLGVEEVQSHE